MTKKKLLALPVALLLMGASCATQSPVNDTNQATGSKNMSFFITSVNPGNGGDLGGLSGADSYCQTLATSVGSGDLTWKAYLSSNATSELAAVNARDRIGNGPWYNAKGELIAESVESLHTQNNISKLTALNEKGEVVSGRGDTVNMHDILTGSDNEGRAIISVTDTTCGNWTNGGADGIAMLGHHDRMGPTDTDAAKSWNSSHLSRGCAPDNLKSTGGAGLFYCFAQ